ncbi:DUF5518 domain-containing protein [Halobacteria archaeon AArc-m2/3/4]|uniref:DUF5518 domain-containing protein n=1 Tax=Natronoglomus mannanivorans TaxID=2979990 RepID=A0ABT2QG44_9EURY|nr:DUF5518 domain-containing protein [Halobacteria archaeon AArc-m2/3/4]
MASVSRRTLRNGAFGAAVGIVLGFVPVLLFVAPLVGGGVAGYLERDGAKRGAIAGSVAGGFVAVIGVVATEAIGFVRFGEVPIAGAPFEVLAVSGVLAFATAAGQILVAGIGGCLVGLLAAERRRAGAGNRPRHPVSTGTTGGVRTRSPTAVVAGLLAGIGTFAVVAFAVTTALDPFVWPSSLVGLPAGAVGGVAVAVLGYLYLTRDTESTVNWRHVGFAGIAVALAFGLVVGGLFVIGQDRISETAERTYEYEYEVTVTMDETLEDVTIYAPVPVENGSSELGDHFVETVQSNRYVLVPEGHDPEPVDPVDFTYELVETERGSMLSISADRIEVTTVHYRDVQNDSMGWSEWIPPEEYDPDDPEMGTSHDGDFRFAVSLPATEEIETADPFDGEPLLSPQSDRREIDCRWTVGDSHRCFEYDSVVYASYDTDDETEVTVHTRLSGRNEWFTGGWTGNEYRDSSSGQLFGPQNGWHRITGELAVGIGRYR